MIDQFARATNSRLNHGKALLFDLDGTLVDSAPDLAEALKQTFLTLKLKPHDEKQVRQWIGNGVDKLLHCALTNSMNDMASGDDFWRARNIFFSDYEKQSGCHSTLYPGVKQALSSFAKQKRLMACITNKNRRFTLPLLEKLGIRDYFSVIVCGDDLSNKKPHPEPLLFAANQLNIKAKDCVMIGDSVSDIGAANAAKMPIVCVDYGYSQGMNLAAMEIDGMVSDIRKINHYFDDALARQCR